MRAMIGISGSDVKNPLVVLQPGAALNLNRTDDTEPFCDLSIPVWQCGLVEKCIIPVRPGHALRTASPTFAVKGVKLR